ncbi:DUF6879 family protein [Streptomyces cacaoi]|uniref:DUF6879 family protein n=1 Tax=Streptomyces cacaoi TaxID=1898 RepID=UPI001FD0A544|nr:DUF6879 family protein [Streptomyces cacaoi]
MARNLALVGSTSGKTGCPAIFADIDTGEILIQGDEVTDPPTVPRCTATVRANPCSSSPEFADPFRRPRSDVSDLIPFAEVSHLFEDFEHTAWRLESRTGYAGDRRSEEYQQFARGEDTTEDLSDPYYVARREQTSQGLRFERVRVIDDPPSDGQRYLLHRAQFNIAVGEDIRVLPRARADRLGLPREDFWLFDSLVLVRMHFDEEDELLGVEVTEDPAAVVHACQVRDAAWHHAVRSAEFEARVRSRR